MHILMVEDDLDLGRALLRALESEHHADHHHDGAYRAGGPVNRAE